MERFNIEELRNMLIGEANVIVGEKINEIIDAINELSSMKVINPPHPMHGRYSNNGGYTGDV